MTELIRVPIKESAEAKVSQDDLFCMALILEDIAHGIRSDMPEDYENIVDLARSIVARTAFDLTEYVKDSV